MAEAGAQLWELSILLWVTIAAVHFIHIGDKLDTLADDEEEDDHDDHDGHASLLNISLKSM